MSVTVNSGYDIAMGRWEPDSKGRLQEAALALYSERGFDQTTAAQIAERAGLTERTFFRHFADKREVLFAGSVVSRRADRGRRGGRSGSRRPARGGRPRPSRPVPPSSASSAATCRANARR